MKTASTLLTLLLVWTLVTVGQPIDKSDSLKIMSSVETVFQTLKTADYNSFETISTNKIYCSPCYMSPDFSATPYTLDRKNFFDNYLKDIIQSDYFIRATQSHDIILTNDPDYPYYRADIIVLFTVYKQDELASGHEGGQFGLYLKKDNNTYKFSGLETLP